jgi:hypothetical protein
MNIASPARTALSGTSLRVAEKADGPDTLAAVLHLAETAVPSYAKHARVLTCSRFKYRNLLIHSASRTSCTRGGFSDIDSSNSGSVISVTFNNQ